MNKYTSLTFFLLFAFTIAFGTNFEANKNITISNDQPSDQYLAGSKIHVNAKVDGDVIATGESVVINDSVFGDLLIGAGSITVNSYIGDDIRVFGGDVEINGIVEGDLIVFAGKVTISEDAVIDGNVISYAGEITLNGFVNGNFFASGGELDINGEIGGNAELKAGAIELNAKIFNDLKISGKEITLGSKAVCEGSVRYWSEDGEMDFSNVSSSATYDEDLAMVDEKFDWGIMAALLGFGIITYWIIFILSAFMVILLLEHFLGTYFSQAADMLSSKFILSFGYGMLYFIGVPVLIVLLFVMIIGIPIGLLLASLYVMTLLFTVSVVGLTVAHFFKNKYGKSWTYFETVAYALLTVVVFKVIFWIPILGWLVKRVVGAAVFGAIILLMTKKKPQLD